MTCELPAFCTVSEPKARHERKCCECRAPILKGEKYTRISGKWDGNISVWCQHDLCAKACEYIRDVINKGEFAEDACVPFGGLMDFIADCHGDTDDELGAMIASIKAREYTP